MTKPQFINGQPVLLCVFNENLTEYAEIPKKISISGNKY